MRKILIFQILAFFTLNSYGQINPVDLNEIKSVSKTVTYKILLDRFLTNDTTLSLDDYRIIYYGQAFQDNYKPYESHDSIRALNFYLNNSKDTVDFKKVLNYTKQILNDFPFNIEQIYVTGVAYDKLGKKELSEIWFYKYEKLILAIMSSGDGKSEKSAFIVTKVADEYSLLNALGLNFEGQSLVSNNIGNFDLMSVSQNDYGIDKLFFNIDLFFGKWE